MRLRVLETEAGTVLVIDGLTREQAAYPPTVEKAWIDRENRPFIIGLIGDVEIPESDNFYPPLIEVRDQDPDFPLDRRFERLFGDSE